MRENNFLSNSFSGVAQSLSSNRNQNLNMKVNMNSGNCTPVCLERTLRRYVGRRCTCDFNINEEMVKKTGILTDVGIDYVILESVNNPNEVLIGDLNDLKFIKIFWI